MIYILIYGLFAVSFIPFRFLRSGDGRYLDKPTTDWIRGIAILIIVIHHAANENMMFQFLYPFQTLGYAALLCSLFFLGMVWVFNTREKRIT